MNSEKEGKNQQADLAVGSRGLPAIAGRKTKVLANPLKSEGSNPSSEKFI